MVDRGKSINTSGVGIGQKRRVGVDGSSASTHEFRSQEGCHPSQFVQPLPGMQPLCGNCFAECRPTRRRVPRVIITMTSEILASKNDLESRHAIAVVAQTGVTANDVAFALEASCPNVSAQEFNVRYYREGEYLVTFPTKEMLDDKMRDGMILVGDLFFVIRRWKCNDGQRYVTSNHVEWLIVKKFPLHCWKMSAFCELVAPFARLIEVDIDSVQRRNIEFLRMKVGCDDLDDIPPAVEVGFENFVEVVEFYLERDHINHSIRRLGVWNNFSGPQFSPFADNDVDGSVEYPHHSSCAPFFGINQNVRGMMRAENSGRLGTTGNPLLGIPVGASSEQQSGQNTCSIRNLMVEGQLRDPVSYFRMPLFATRDREGSQVAHRMKRVAYRQVSRPISVAVGTEQAAGDVGATSSDDGSSTT